MDKIELMQKEIEDKRKLPKEVKSDIKKAIFHNLLIAIIIIAYLCVINILYFKLENQVFEQQMKFFALGIILVTVGVFEIAYRRESKRMCIIGIELLLCSIISLYIPYIYLFVNGTLKNIIMTLPFIIAAYYIIKAFFIYKTREIRYQSNLSDVKEILKDTEKKSYLDEESKKVYREKQEYEEKMKQELLEEQRKKAENKKNQATKKKKTQKGANTTKTTKKSKTSKSVKTSKTTKKKTKGL